MSKMDRPEAIREAVLEAVRVMMKASAPTERMTTKDVTELVEFVARASVGVVLARISAEMLQQQFDETVPSTPGGGIGDIVQNARDLGYRAGANDTVRRWGKLLAEAVHSAGS